METEDIQRLKQRIITELKRAGRPLTSRDLQQLLSISPGLLSKAIYELLREGIVEKVYTDEFDPTRPFDTASWRLRVNSNHGFEGLKPEPLLKDLKLVLSVPISLHAERVEILNRHNAMDFFDAYSYIIELAEYELKIVCPVIDLYGISPIINKLSKLPDLKVRIITELDKSRDLEYIIDVVRLKNLKILNASRKSVGVASGVERKVSGVHMKMAIADDKLALVGTFNFSKHHYLVNFDIGFIISDSRLVKALSDLFEELWVYAGGSS